MLLWCIENSHERSTLIYFVRPTNVVFHSFVKKGAHLMLVLNCNSWFVRRLVNDKWAAEQLLMDCSFDVHSKQYKHSVCARKSKINQSLTRIMRYGLSFSKHTPQSFGSFNSALEPADIRKLATISFTTEFCRRNFADCFVPVDTHF